MNSDILRALRASLFAALVCTCFVGLFPARSLAQDARDEAAYKELVEQALGEFKHKNWPEARVLFMRAHELNPNARTLRGMGVVSYEMRDYLNAVVNLQAALEDKRQPLTEAQRKECDGLLARARTFVGVFTLKLDPLDAHVSLDGGEPTRDDKGHLMVPFGEHTVSARARGRLDASTRLTVQGGERGEIALSLPSDVPLVPGAVAVAPVAPVVTVIPADSAQGSQAAGRRPAKDDDGFVGHGLKYTWVALGASAVFGAGAAAFWMLGDKKLDSLDSQCSQRASGDNPCVKGDTDTDQIKLYQTLTNASIGVSAAALVTAGILMGLEWPRERRLAFGVGNKSLFFRGAF